MKSRLPPEQPELWDGLQKSATDTAAARRSRRKARYATDAKYREEQKVKALEHHRRNREKRIAKCRKYYADNRESLRKKVREYQRKHREEIIARKRRIYRSESAHRKYLNKVYGRGAADHYFAQLRKQGGTCAACGETPKRRLAQDHHALSGQLRGLLCSTYCNRVIGYAKERPDVLRKLADYLEEWQSELF